MRTSKKRQACLYLWTFLCATSALTCCKPNSSRLAGIDASGWVVRPTPAFSIYMNPTATAPSTITSNDSQWGHYPDIEALQEGTDHAGLLLNQQISTYISDAAVNSLTQKFTTAADSSSADFVVTVTNSAIQVRLCPALLGIQSMVCQNYAGQDFALYYVGVNIAVSDQRSASVVSSTDVGSATSNRQMLNGNGRGGNSLGGGTLSDSDWSGLLYQALDASIRNIDTTPPATSLTTPATLPTANSAQLAPLVQAQPRTS